MQVANTNANVACVGRQYTTKPPLIGMHIARTLIGIKRMRLLKNLKLLLAEILDMANTSAPCMICFNLVRQSLYSREL